MHQRLIHDPSKLHRLGSLLGGKLRQLGFLNETTYTANEPEYLKRFTVFFNKYISQIVEVDNIEQQGTFLQCGEFPSIWWFSPDQEKKLCSQSGEFREKFLKSLQGGVYDKKP